MSVRHCDDILFISGEKQESGLSIEYSRQRVSFNKSHWTYNQHHNKSTWKSLHVCIWTAAWTLYTIKLGFGQNASTNAESVLLIADVESWNGRVMRNLKVQKSTALSHELIGFHCFINRDCRHVYIVCRGRWLTSLHCIRQPERVQKLQYIVLKCRSVWCPIF